MARSRLLATSDDRIKDTGAVLWSFVKGEQLEEPIDLSFLSSDLNDYDYEAVVIEADNKEGQASPPLGVADLGSQTVLNVRQTQFEGAWSASTSYSRGQQVTYNGQLFEKMHGTGVISADVPPDDKSWAEAKPNRLYVQFPETLGDEWGVLPEVSSPIYGFFELQVTEKLGLFKRKWKPARGVVEILFSPTHVVP